MNVYVPSRLLHYGATVDTKMADSRARVVSARTALHAWALAKVARETRWPAHLIDAGYESAGDQPASCRSLPLPAPVERLPFNSHCYSDAVLPGILKDLKERGFHIVQVLPEPVAQF